MSQSSTSVTPPPGMLHMMIRGPGRAGAVVFLALAMTLAGHPLLARTAIDTMIGALEARGIAIDSAGITSAGARHHLADVTITARFRPQFRTSLLTKLFDEEWVIQTSLAEITLTEIDPAIFRLELPREESVRTIVKIFDGTTKVLETDFMLEGQDITLDITDGEIDFAWAFDRAAITTVQTSDAIQITSEVELLDHSGAITMTGPVGRTEVLTYTARVGSTRQLLDSPVEIPTGTDRPQTAFFESGYEVMIVISPQKSALKGLIAGIPVISGSYVAKPSVAMFLPDRAVPDVTATVLIQANSFDILLDEAKLLLSADLAGLEFLHLRPGSESPILQSDGHVALLSLAAEDPGHKSLVGTVRLQTDALRVNKDVLRQLDPGSLLADTTISHDIELGFEATVAGSSPTGDAMPFERLFAEIRTFSLDILGTTLTASGSLERVSTDISRHDFIGRIDLETRNLPDLIGALTQIPGVPPVLLFLAVQALNDSIPDWQINDGETKRYTYIFEPGDRMTINGRVP